MKITSVQVPPQLKTLIIVMYYVICYYTIFSTTSKVEYSFYIAVKNTRSHVLVDYLSNSFLKICAANNCFHIIFFKQKLDSSLEKVKIEYRHTHGKEKKSKKMHQAMIEI